MKKYILFFTPAFFLFTAMEAQTIGTFAGTGANAYTGDGGAAYLAGLSSPSGLAIDGSGNVYIADNAHHVIRKVDAAGNISTFAGTGTGGFSGDMGPATAAMINAPYGIAVDASNNIYFADTDNNRVRMVNASGIISTYAGTGAIGSSGDGGAATAAKLHTPTYLAIDAAGVLYIADYLNHKVRMVNGTTGIISTLAGSGVSGYSGDGGPAASAQLSFPEGLAVNAGGDVYIADYGNNRIRVVNSGAGGNISTFAGNGTAGFSGDGGLAASAQINGPCGIKTDASGRLYIADVSNQRIRLVNTSGTISTLAGTGMQGYSGDGDLATTARINMASDITVDASGNVYIADFNNNRVRKVCPSPPALTVSGNSAICAGSPTTISVSGATIYVWAANAGAATTTSTVVTPYANTWYAVMGTTLGCSRKDSVLITPIPGDSISGLVTDTNNVPLTSGKVYLFKRQAVHPGNKDTIGFVPIQSNGAYFIPHQYVGHYIIKAIADTTIYPTAVPTYFTPVANNYQWDSTLVLNHNTCAGGNNTGNNIKVLMLSPTTGPGTVSGTITEGPGYGQKLTNNNGVMAPGNPISHVGVSLGKKPSGQIASRTMTNTNGHYSFQNVPIGNYYVFVDIPNFVMDTLLSISITASSNTINNLNYFADSLNIRLDSLSTAGIKQANTGINFLKVYPNPANGNITLSAADELGLITIYNSLGEIIYQHNSKGHQQQIDISRHKAGVYFIQAAGRHVRVIKE